MDTFTKAAFRLSASGERSKLAALIVSLLNG